MECKKYRAPTLKEAKLKMLLDVGKRGYIVNQRTVREGGLFGLFGKPMVEITVNILTSGASADEYSNIDYMDKDFNFGTKKINNGYNTLLKSNPKNSVLTESSIETNSYKEALERIREIGLSLSKVEEGKVSPNQDNQMVDLDVYIKQELSELREMLEEIKSNNNQKNKTQNLQTQNPKINDNNDDEKYNTVRNLLKDYDFSDTIIERYVNLKNYVEISSENDSTAVIEKVVSDLLNKAVNLSDGINIEDSKPKSIIFVGPTGVGKTTTLAKLGAYYGIIQGKRVKFVSMDNYRVGAVQQLKIYAEIMGIPFAKVTLVEELKKEIDYNSYDVILIDTAGKSQKTEEEILEIKEYIDVFEPDTCICLVISSTTKYKDLLEILDKFSILRYTNIIATKIDETNSFGQVLSALVERGLTLSYITFGQSVPEHLKSATKINLLETLFNY